jgi:hypothetical protein
MPDIETRLEPEETTPARTSVIPVEKRNARLRAGDALPASRLEKTIESRPRHRTSARVAKLVPCHTRQEDRKRAGMGMHGTVLARGHEKERSSDVVYGSGINALI